VDFFSAEKKAAPGWIPPPPEAVLDFCSGFRKLFPEAFLSRLSAARSGSRRIEGAPRNCHRVRTLRGRIALRSVGWSSGEVRANLRRGAERREEFLERNPPA